MTLGQGALETVVLATTKRHNAVALLGFHRCAFPPKHTVIAIDGNEQKQVCSFRKCEKVFKWILVQTLGVSDTALGSVRVGYPVVVTKRGGGTRLASGHIGVVASMAAGMGHSHFVSNSVEQLFPHFAEATPL